MPSRNKLLACVVAAAAVISGAVSNLGGTVATPAAAQDLATIRFGDQTGSEVDYAAIWVADLNGYFKDEGIQVERKIYANGPATLLDINNLDATTAAIVPYMLFAARGGEMTMVMSTTKGNAPIVGKKQYTSVKELAGKNVGTPGIGTIHDAVLGYIEETQGFKVNHVPAKISDVAVMIEKGEVEAFIGWEPASAAAIAQAPELLHYIQRLPPIADAESLELAFRPGYVKEHPDNVMRFIRATLKAIAWIKTNGPEKTAELLSKKMNDPGSYKVNLDALQSVDLTKPRIDMPSTRVWLAAIAKQGKIPEDLVKDVDGWVGKYVDYSFLEKAEASLKN